MSTYLFHLHECGEVTVDHEGLDLANEEEAIDCAIRAARSIMAAEVLQGRLCLHCHIEVQEESRSVARVSFKDAVEVSGAN